MIFVSLAYVLMASAQQLPASTWDHSLFLLPHYNSPLAMAPGKTSRPIKWQAMENKFLFTTITAYQTH